MVFLFSASLGPISWLLQMIVEEKDLLDSLRGRGRADSSVFDSFMLLFTLMSVSEVNFRSWFLSLGIFTIFVGLTAC